jgi:hypothetical protein
MRKGENRSVPIRPAACVEEVVVGDLDEDIVKLGSSDAKALRE